MLALVTLAWLVSGAGPPAAVAAVTYHVDRGHPAAADSNPGTADLPFRTITRGVCGARPGDTVVVKGGSEGAPVLYAERVVLGAYLSPDCGLGGPMWSVVQQPEVYLTVRAEPRRGVLMYGFDNSRNDGNQRGWLHVESFQITTEVLGGTVYGIAAEHATAQRVIDNAFQNVTHTAIRVMGPAAHEVRRNTVQRANKGIEISGDGYVVEDNTVTALTNFGYDVDYLRFFGQNGVIRRNRVYGTDMNPSNIGSAHVDCLQTWASRTSWVRNIRIEDNLCADAHQGLLARAIEGAITGLVVRNNIFMRMEAWGSVISNEDAAVGPTGHVDMLFQNNAVVHIGIHGFGCLGFSRCKLHNNIFYNAGSNYITENSSVIQAGSNLLYRIGKTLAGFADRGNILNRDPLFHDPGSPANLGSLGDFRLEGGSPAIDTGIAVEGFATDRDGTSRPQGSGWDIGPYEHRAGSATPTELRVRPVP